MAAPWSITLCVNTLSGFTLIVLAFSIAQETFPAGDGSCRARPEK